MPIYASVAAHAVIDTLALLMWHQIVFSRLSQESSNPSNWRSLIDYYMRQCQPLPLPIQLLCRRILPVDQPVVLDTALPEI